MKLEFTIFRQGDQWIASQLTETTSINQMLPWSIKTRGQAVKELAEQHPYDKVYVDGVLASEFQYEELTKKDFRELVLDNDSPFGKTITIGDVTFNQGRIYNPRVNEGRGYCFMGEKADEKLVNSLWRFAKKEGMISVGNEDYYII